MTARASARPDGFPAGLVQDTKMDSVRQIRGARTSNACWQLPPSPGELLAMPDPRREATPVIHQISELKPCEESLPTVISGFGTLVRTATPHVDAKPFARHRTIVVDPGSGGSCGQYDAYGSTFASVTLPG